MAETPEGLLARLDALGIAHRTVRHAPVFTVAESQALRGDLPGTHSKNLFLAPAKGEGPLMLATLEEHRRISVNALARAAGWPRVRMGDAAALAALLGVLPGSVTPFGLVNAPPGSVRFVLDRALAEAPGLVWVHPLTNDASTGLAAPDLIRFLDHLGHTVAVLDTEVPIA
ncbi:MAG TPA: prolyl-tRNA synthetase associated domain-containing protein [Roseomonas sp.]|jgi:Ala-tRNA(Pro) deacylase